MNNFQINDLVIYSNTGQTYRVVKVDGDHVGMYRQGPNGDTGRFMLVSSSKLTVA